MVKGEVLKWAKAQKSCMDLVLRDRFVRGRPRFCRMSDDVVL